MNTIDAILTAVDRIFGRHPARLWFCEHCLARCDIREMVVEEDPQINGMHVYFCSADCNKKWFEKENKYWSN